MVHGIISTSLQGYVVYFMVLSFYAISHEMVIPCTKYRKPHSTEAAIPCTKYIGNLVSINIYVALS